MTAIPAVISVPYETFDLKEAYPDGKFASSMVFQCAWGQRHTLAGQLLGSATQIIGGAGLPITYTLPAPHPYIGSAFVKQISSIVGYPDDPDFDRSGGALPDYKYAHLTVEYEIPIWGVNPPTNNGSYYIEENIETSVDFITSPTLDLEWFSGAARPVDASEAPGVQDRSIVFTYRVAGIPTLPSAVVTLVGSCNANPVTFNTIGQTAPAETVLYSMASLRRFIYSNGVGAWDAQFRFPFKPFGWNKFRKSATTAPEFIRQISTGTIWRPYQPLSWAGLGL